MLADNGINRDTILSFVRDIINEKTDKEAKRVANETNLDEMVRSIIKREIGGAVCAEIREKVRQCFSSISVSINMKE